MKLNLKLLLLAVIILAGNNVYSQAQTLPYAKTTQQAVKHLPPETMPITPSESRKLGEQMTCDYRISLAATPVKGWYAPVNGQLVWITPETTANEHLEVTLVNTIDQKTLPNSGGSLSIYDLNNKLLETKPLIMMWSPEGYHYGNNFIIPGNGNYNVKVDLTPPMFARHNRQIGNRFFNPASVVFQNVKLLQEGQLKE